MPRHNGPRRGVLALVALLILGAGGGIAIFGLQRGIPARPITIDYPPAGALFPPDFAPPTLEWHDATPAVTSWTIEVRAKGEASPVVRITSSGEAPRLGPIDPEALGPTNKPPVLSPERASAHTWTPDAATWATIKRVATSSPAVVTVTGSSGSVFRRTLSRGEGELRVSTDPVGAPILYRDVPLMPSAGERGVIQPLNKRFMPLIAWRLRAVFDAESRVLMTGLHSCTNCHSVSRDGKMLGLDIDGPRNNKGLYAMLPIVPDAAIRKEHVITWSTFRGKLGGKMRVAFMSQISPDGRHIVTMINDPGLGQSDYERTQRPEDLRQNYYVANFTDYRFLQVFYPARGILAWYSKETGRLEPLPGADDPAYVHTGATWSPDGKYLVFSRAGARTAYPEGVAKAERANDPNETQIQYDLYRIPFNDGKGGTPEPIAGASNNGMSNSFPKYSPDGRWIVFVQARNGQLMRPDSKLFIVPAQGGEAREMRANTPLMNSWHSFSPNGRWMVFSSKSRTPYTEMFLTHIDEHGHDTPAIVIENSTAANRAVNIPEFVNIPPGGLRSIDTPVADFYRLIDLASDAMDAGRNDEAVALLRQAVASDPDDAEAHNDLGYALVSGGAIDAAVAEFRSAIALSPDYPDAHYNLASALAQTDNGREAVAEYRKALALKPDYPDAQAGLGTMLALEGRTGEAIPILQKAVQRAPDHLPARMGLALALSNAGRTQDALIHAKQAVVLSNGENPRALELLGRFYAQLGQQAKAVETTGQAVDAATRLGDRPLADDLRARLSSYLGSAQAHSY